MTKIYIPYGTTEGQTAKIAEYIADVVVLERLASAFFSVSLAAHGDTAEAESYVAEFEQDTAGAPPWSPSLAARWSIPRRVPQTARDEEDRSRQAGQGTDTSRDYVYTEWDGVRRFAEDFLEGCLPDGAKLKNDS